MGANIATTENKIIDEIKTEVIIKEPAKNHEYYLKFRKQQLEYKKKIYHCEICNKNIVNGSRALHMKSLKHKHNELLIEKDALIRELTQQTNAL